MLYYIACLAPLLCFLIKSLCNRDKPEVVRRNVLCPDDSDEILRKNWDLLLGPPKIGGVENLAFATKHDITIPAVYLAYKDILAWQTKMRAVFLVALETIQPYLLI